MVVGVCRLELSLPATSLKDKRRVVRSLIDRTRSRFGVSIAEVDAQDAHSRAVLGVAYVSTDARHAGAVLANVVRAVEMSPDALLTDYSVQMY